MLQTKKSFSKCLTALTLILNTQSFASQFSDNSIVYEYDEGSDVARLRAQVQSDGRVAFSADGNLVGHGAQQIVYNEFFSLGHGLPEEPRGRYIYSGALSADEYLPHLPNRSWESLMYCDGKGGYYSANISHNKLERDGRLYGSLIASISPGGTFHMVGGAREGGDDSPLPRGVYRVQPVCTTIENGLQRNERWSNLNTGIDYTILPPGNSWTIPGMFLSYATQVNALSPEVAQLQTAVANFKRDLDESLPGQYTGHYTCAYGPTGSGKSTVLSAKLGEVLEADPDFRLFVREPVGEIRIGHSRGAAGTTKHTVIVKDGQAYVDLCGIQDVTGGATEIINAATMAHLLGERARDAKILLTCIEGQLRTGRGYLRNTLQQLVEMFPNPQMLHNSLSFIITDQARLSPLRTLRNHLRDFREAGNVDARVLAVLEFLIAHPDRLFVMPAPDDEGVYDTEDFIADFDAALNSYRPVRFSPQNLRISVSADGAEFASVAGMELSNYIEHLLSIEGARYIYRYAQELVHRSHLPAEEIRGVINTFKSKVEAVKAHDFAHLNAFEASWRAVCSYPMVNKPLFSALKNLQFLCKVNPNLAANIVSIPGLPTAPDLATAFDSILQHLAQLAKTPEFVDTETGILQVKGAIIALSEVVQAINPDLRSNLSRVDVFATNKVVFDSTLQRNLSIAITSPTWDVIYPSRIILDGMPGFAGANGANGQAGIAGVDASPGHPGGNGGHFYGKGFQFFGLENLSISSNGGKGGNGGRGGSGSPAGKGARGGVGGLPGTCQLVPGHSLSIEANNGVNGEDGASGASLPYPVQVPTNGVYEFKVDNKDLPEYDRKHYVFGLEHCGKDWIRRIDGEYVDPEDLKKYIEEKQSIPRASITRISGKNPGNPHHHKVHKGGKREWFAEKYIINYTYNKPETVTPAAPTGLAPTQPTHPTPRVSIEPQERSNSYWQFYSSQALNGEIVRMFPGILGR